MRFETFFELGESFEPGAYRVLPEDPQLDAISIAQGIETPPQPCRFVHDSGKRAYDLMGTGDPALILLSSCVLRVLRGGKFTGWRSFPVEIVERKGKRIDGYEALVVTGRCGPIDWTKGSYTRRPSTVSHGQGHSAWIGMYFDPKSWDGSDLFMPEGTTYKIVSGAVKQAFERAHLTNIFLTALTEFERTWQV